MTWAPSRNTAEKLQWLKYSKTWGHLFGTGQNHLDTIWTLDSGNQCIAVFGRAFEPASPRRFPPPQTTAPSALETPPRLTQHEERIRQVTTVNKAVKVYNGDSGSAKGNHEQGTPASAF